MNQAAGEGGGAGGGNVVVDHATLDAVAAGLAGAGADLDGVGGSRPSGGGTGLAEPLLLAILAGTSESAARVAFEASTLAAIVEDCNAVAQSADRAAAESMLVEGFGPSSNGGGGGGR